MRISRVVLPALLVVGLATPAQAVQPRNNPPQEPSSGFTVSGSQLVWRSPAPLPVGDSAVEFWDGDRMLGRARPSADHRTFTLTATSAVNPRELSVRSSGRRLDASEPLRPMQSKPPATPPAALPAAPADPGKPGPFRTASGEYTLDSVKLPEYPQPVEMQANVIAPVGAPGKRPVALLLHGRHSVCYKPGEPDSGPFVWPCPAGTKSIPSYRGYLQAQQLLASQGYVTVSISANGINAQDGATADQGAQGRSSLVRQHLAKWADWAGAGRGTAPDVVQNAPVPDMSNVLLMGHSRGGEGVNRAAMDSLTPPPGDTGYNGPVLWNIRGTLLIGPTIFGHDPVPDVPSATILPGCDGDVSDLQGQMFVDATRGVSRGAALHSALYVVGANHNFFNTEWTPGQAEAPAQDDFWSQDPDAVCTPGTPTRLTAAQQQNVGATYIAAAAQVFVGGDQRVLPLLDGSGVSAPSAAPARVLSHAIGGARGSFVTPSQATTTSGKAQLCRIVTPDTASACAEQQGFRSQTHYVRLWGVDDDPDRFAVKLSGAGTIHPERPVSLAGARNLALRLVVPPNSTGNEFDVAVTDVHGRKATLGSVSLDGLPSTDRTSTQWAQEVRVPLPPRGIDLRQVAALDLTPTSGPGEAVLIDAHGWAPGLPDPRPVSLPRIDLGELSVQEGDSGTRTYEVPVKVTGNGTGAVRLFLSNDDREVTTKLETIRPGQQSIKFPVDVTGNTRWSFDQSKQLLAKAVRGTVVGRYTGGLTVLNDDPEPVLTVAPANAETEEGGVLKWTVTSSAVADSALTRSGALSPEVQGQELSTVDVDPQWFKEHSPEDPLPARPLSEVRLWLSLSVEPGRLTTEFTIPTVADQEVEPTESVRVKMSAWPPSGNSLDFTGTVTDKK
ncbi:alpha/beta hydrolase family protein [Kibdelosporangium phytohabitans]|uniref:Secreted protein n=1 Tax=Kibdelosporangium phytohabitans TaxID=860235 RepID=A0A0N9IC53_9PSEU|nr:hypothetical protein [Kibdelosporangium phytohabitans]ALG13980.1 hypothetical protein AOZ06_50285 [Kibdelosporangium phytohabitans]MBE1467068.1 hypothetical protein [Kibdelosporangium phytohabitans]